MYLVHSKHSKSPFKQKKFNSATRRWTHSTYAKRVMSWTILHLCSNFLLRYLPNFISLWQYSSKWKCLTSSIMAKPSNISSLQSSKGSLNASLVILKLMALWHKWHYVGFKSSTNFFSAFNDFVHTSGICHKSLKILEWDSKYTARAICIVSIVSYFVMLVIFIFKMQRVVDTNMVITSSYSEKKISTSLNRQTYLSYKY